MLCSPDVHLMFVDSVMYMGGCRLMANTTLHYTLASQLLTTGLQQIFSFYYQLFYQVVWIIHMYTPQNKASIESSHHNCNTQVWCLHMYIDNKFVRLPFCLP